MLHPLRPIALAATLLAGTTAHAAIYRVGSDAACTHSTIQSAIDAAAATSDAVEIRIRAGSHADTALEIGNESSPLHLVGGFADCAAETPQPQTWSTLFGTSGHSVVAINGATDVTLTSLVLSNATTLYDGAGIWYVTLAGQLTLVDTLVNNNTAREGGGIVIGNPDGDAGPDAVRLVLRGRSVLLGNQATHGNGGGIFCARATVRVLDDANLQYNAALIGNGGGIFADNCRVELASRGSLTGNGILSFNSAAAGRGGGLYLTGARASAVAHPIDSEHLPKIHGNSAQRGGAIAVTGGAQVDLYEGWISQNAATLDGAAFWVADGGASGLDTRVTMHATLAGAPPGAVACAVHEDCNRMRGNLALDAAGNPGSGVAVSVAAAVPGAPSGSAHARFEGTRIDDSSGHDLVSQTSADGHIVFDGALIVDNDLTGFVAISTAPTSSLAFVATTIAGNLLGSGSTVLLAPLTCSVDSEARGTRIERSIIWQPGHALLATFGGVVQADCYRHLVGNRFDDLPDSPERVVADPQFQGPAQGDYTLGLYSPAIDFAPAHPGDATRDGGARVFDLDYLGNRFGPQDLGAYESASDEIFRNGFDCPDC